MITVTVITIIMPKLPWQSPDEIKFEKATLLRRNKVQSIFLFLYLKSATIYNDDRTIDGADNCT